MRSKSSESRHGLAIACAVAVATLGLVGAAPARAENDFANGFEDQLGRIVAHQAVGLGFLLLSGGLQPQRVWHDPYSGYGHARPYSYRPPRRVYRRHGHDHGYANRHEGRVVYERRSRFFDDGRSVEIERRIRY